MAKGESVISSDLSIDLDNSFFLFTNLQAFLVGQGVLEPLSQQHCHWNALLQLVWTWRRSGGVNSSKFSEIPVLWSRNSFNNLSLTFIAHLV